MIKRKLLLPFFAFISVILLHGCVDIPSDFKAPVWSVGVFGPGTDTTITIKKMIEDDTSVVKWRNDPGVIGLLYFSDTTKIDPVKIEDNLKIDNFSTSFNQSIGEIKINNIPSDSVSVTLGDWGEAPGSAVPFGEIVIGPDVEFPVIDEFEEVTFKTATLNITIINRLPLPIDIQEVKIVNVVSNQNIFSKAYTNNVGVPSGGGLRLTADGGSAVIPITLDGKTLTNRMKFVGTLAKPGNQTVDLDANDGTIVLAEFDNGGLSVQSAKAVLPAQDPFNISGQVSLSDSNQVEEAVLEGGQLNLVIDNNFDLDIQIDLTLNELRTPSGSSYSANINLLANQQGNTDATIADLAGYKIASSVPGQTITDFNYDLTVTVNGSPGGTASTISVTDDIAASIDFANLAIKSFTGRVAPFSFDLANTSFDLDFGDFNKQFGFTQINFADPTIQISLINSADIEAGIKGAVIASNGTTAEDQNINLDALITGNATTLIDLSADFKTAFQQFKSGLPDHFEVSGAITANPDYKIGVVEKSDSVKGEVLLDLPMDVGIAAGTFVDTMDLDNEPNEDVNKLNEAAIVLEISNKIPVEIKFSGQILDANGNVTMNIPPNPVTVGSGSPVDYIFIPGPVVDASGNVTAATTVQERISITGDQVQKFLNGKKMIMSLELMTAEADAGSPPKTVRFTINDELSIKLWGEANILLDFED